MPVPLFIAFIMHVPFNRGMEKQSGFAIVEVNV